MAIIIDGNKVAEKVYEELKNKIDKLEDKKHFKPGVAILMAGDDKSSKMYVNMIKQKCEWIGIRADVFEFESEVDTDTVIDKIEELNEDCTYCGIIVQFPMPKGIDTLRVRESISPNKDVDSAGSANIGKFYATNDCYVPCTPKSMHRLLKEVDIDLVGLDAVVIGRSHVVGKPIADILLNENMTVTVCHSRTKNLSEYTKRADVIMAGAGVAHLVTADMVKENAIIIDAGINVKDGQLLGDVDTESVMDKAYAVTPVPGGVGPMTIAMLIENVIEACYHGCVKR
ncbi:MULTISPECIES: bifunctional 5,10-methylenetetrahydrofolate dehydrogenase/5,10-methenyltetrahydrofolate cyclohydrolase [unclassified Fusibacter]|uniref:bifunctional 5,10-methylenetetrahydrofolate dehydrogenase/5,10-methenyltetrahydrofolate cyclohydrolase n=1 Tax=unclassified Fusibacter TaxID=2624464 RepID=UPI0010101B76|nr:MULTISPECIES: bifunctional 5,10-methylenetetrahydrofolate dehydrogenase/5,10-methenyltetrahydrofolate cyclohydrolase [unclassified Fusibacter]MCK8058886.1 bifunctional 5,10-methylenetetrahydrofolate dehydrogenase/5,10-methenyltetrahydrofolate cyclohydrolase [Fusibacter sp. A2]NPE21961.1 bifunctional 5,10-methylenetetrahydrofolate dehydrogenase/5,10-methenyltetrahydrofolate cyclohydrolase [Fusibacter sp. A1]RXV61529.1 bifunctional 5,10-methylenetetrahydrofolate dehydrogenase/5,10-methenyltetra